MKPTSKILAIATLMLGINAFAIDESASKTFPTPQKAEGVYVAHVGIVGGYADPIGPLKPAIAYGVDAGFQPFIPFGLGIQALFYNTSQDQNGFTLGVKRTEIMGRLTYNFGGENEFIRHSYAGGKVGAIVNKPYAGLINGPTTDGDSYTRLGLAPVVGFDYPIANNFSLGASGSYLFMMGPETYVNTPEILAVLKYLL